jgi:hypothetical protein
MHTPLSAPSVLTDPPALLAIARAARLTGNRDLERAARQLLKDHWGISLVFCRSPRGKEARYAAV